MFLKQSEQDLFSYNELQAIKIIGKKTTTMKEIADELYDHKTMPKYATTAVSSLISRINAKAKKNYLNFKIAVGHTNGGRTPKQISIVKKSPT